MKLAEHVNDLKELIESAFDKQFARLGFGKTKQMDSDNLPEEVQAKRERFIAMLENHIGETGDYEHAREKLMDELTFTLFNRLAAIKVMEAASLFPPILSKQTEHGDRSFGHKAWLEINPHMRSEELEGIRDYLKTSFDELGLTLPLYSKTYPYALLPDAISLNDIIDTFNAVEIDAQVGDDIWHSDDVLGWMYESYNNTKKKAFKESKDKVEFDKVSLQSQVYTPRWVVQFLVENSLGKIYLEMYPHSQIKQRYKIANPPETQTRTPKPLHEVRIIDPACGSGNFLLYAFDFYYECYLDQIENYGANYDEKDISKLIIENNLHGIDLDDRAIQLAQLGLYIKARKKHRNIGELNFRVVSSDFYLPEYDEVRHIFEQGTGIGRNQQELIEKIWSDLQYAYKFGSLVHIDEQLNRQLQRIKSRAESEKVDLTKKITKKVKEADLFAKAELIEHKDFTGNFFSNLTKAVEQYARTGNNTFLTRKTRDAITFLELLTTEYDVATANPPYTDSSDFGPNLKEFIEDNYKRSFKFNTNLYATFIKRCYDFVNKNGLVAMLHPLTFMYIKSYEDVRKFILNKSNINLLVELGLGGVFANSDVQVDVVMYVLEKGKATDNGTYFDLKKYKNHTNKPEIFSRIYDNYISGVPDSRIYNTTNSKLKTIKSWPFIYWISDEFRDKFSGKTLNDYFEISFGLKTADNLRYLKFHWEISGHSERPYDVIFKAGPYNKWYGNLWLCLDYEYQKPFIAKEKSSGFSGEKNYKKFGIVCSSVGSKSTSFRVNYDSIFSNADLGIYRTEENKNSSVFSLLGYLNSKLVQYINGMLNPTVNLMPNDLKRIPYIAPLGDINNQLHTLSQTCVDIKQYLSRYELISINFELHPLSDVDLQLDSKKVIKDFLNVENYLFTHVLINEAVINLIIFQLYELTENDKAAVLFEVGASIGGLPLLIEAREAYLSEIELIKKFSIDPISEFIKSLPTESFDPDKVNNIEAEFSTLYQGNNTLEEFCIRHQINPINIWYWFKQSNVIPKQRMNTLAMEFLVDLIREILMEDEDGIIPLVPNSGEKILLDRIEEKFLDRGFRAAQYSSFDSILGRPIHEYLNQYLLAELSNYLKLFKQLPATPFIWHLTSGPEQGFDCYIIIYKWSRDNLMRLRSVYIENRERALINRQSDIAGNESAEAQNEKEKIFKQLKEIESFKVKIDELLAEGYNPILDDGVGKNIAPLQKKSMLPYDVLNTGQLKKYLNADW